jgi:hypothetical protein
MIKQNRKSKNIFLLFLFLGCLYFAEQIPVVSRYLIPAALAADGSKIHWVSPNGAASWSDCEKATDPGGNYCALNTANNNIQPGDTAYLKGGTYVCDDATYGRWNAAIAPTASGTSQARITYSAAPGETPELVMADQNQYLYGIYLGSNIAHFTTINYAKISGITFRNFTAMGEILNYSSHN